MKTPEESAREAWEAISATVYQDGVSVLDALTVHIHERDTEVRREALDGFEVEAGMCSQTKWTPGDDPLLKTIRCTVPPTKHGAYHADEDGNPWRVTDDLPVLPSRVRLVGPWALTT